MSAAMKFARWKSWRPTEYIHEYFRNGVEPDEQAAIPFQVDFLRRAGRSFPRALEYGCGPTLMRALAASAYVESLDMADRLDHNLQRIKSWAIGDSQADDWRPFTEYVLNCEGVAAPGGEDVSARERRTRRVLSGLLLTDARDRYPLGQNRAASYDLLISSFCVDCLSQSKAVWRRCMRNIFGLLKPGGLLCSSVASRLRGLSRRRPVVPRSEYPIRRFEVLAA